MPGPAWVGLLVFGFWSCRPACFVWCVQWCCAAAVAAERPAAVRPRLEKGVNVMWTKDPDATGSPVMQSTPGLTRDSILMTLMLFPPWLNLMPMLRPTPMSFPIFFIMPLHMPTTLTQPSAAPVRSPQDRCTVALCLRTHLGPLQQAAVPSFSISTAWSLPLQQSLASPAPSRGLHFKSPRHSFCPCRSFSRRVYFVCRWAFAFRNIALCGTQCS